MTPFPFLEAIIRAHAFEKPAEEEAPAGPTEIELLTEIRDALKK